MQAQSSSNSGSTHSERERTDGRRRPAAMWFVAAMMLSLSCQDGMAATACPITGSLVRIVTHPEPGTPSSGMVPGPSGIRVRATGPGGTVETVTDDAGRFTLPGVPGETYDLRVDLPRAFAFYYAPPDAVTVRGCRAETFVFIGARRAPAPAPATLVAVE